MDIRELDVSDPAARRAWYDVQEASARADRPHALLQAFDAFEVSATRPGAYVDRLRLEARDGDLLVGVADLELPLTENLDVAWAEVNVLPAHRRKGTGRSLWEAVVDRARAAGRTRVGGEVSVDLEVSGAGAAFATAMGAVEKHREDHLLAELPVPTVPIAADYELIAWRGRCPDEHRADYLAMRNQMNADIPTGDLDLEATVLDDARLATSEQRLGASYDVRVAAARHRPDGVFGGYSLLFVPHGADHGWQDDTLVMPEHRGHRLGAALKAANYADLPAHVRLVHTWTAPSNTAMHHTNTALGFRVVEHMYEMEASIDTNR
ncbi:Acetyltransferase (GNAT) family protein [Nocardioides alpinus]|uniref:Acetyltransferase (GNAT) family protein n=1 Tax=Nocardioides alpinus TaxID=748909 RepID=A0A1I0XWV4_9ACTN|nr:GNAT family N-acetyltransferase [Nocardioides alpinus]SFB04433.1 Acetyltransferase (GNAT) family protein [Nocardioides alpinus]